MIEKVSDRKKLEEKRFIISPESLELMKKLRDALPQIQVSLPEVEGFSFYGSRTVGLEKEGSDLDLYTIVDFSKTEHGYSQEFIADLMEVLISKNILSREEVKKIERTLILDISKTGTDKDLKNFIETINPNKEPSNHLLEVGTKRRIAARFFLGVGERLYNNRKYIFDELEKMDNGEKIWAEIIKHVSFLERDRTTSKRGSLPSYNMYPKTIAEARKYFINREPKLLERV